MLDSLWNKRAVLVSGKGGVGKTTLSAAMAVAAARSGRPVLLAELSPDEGGPSHLAGLVGAKDAGAKVVPVRPNLSFVRLSASEGHRQFLEETLPAKWLAEAALRSRALRRFLEAGPALKEMGLLYQMLTLVRRTHPDGRPLYPLAVLDLPATGHAMALATLPRSLLSLIPGGPIGRAMREGLDLLQDPKRTGVVLTTLPEPLPVSETLSLAKELKDVGLPLSVAVLNRLPEDPFTPESLAALGRLLETHGPHRGQRALERLERAREARQRLQAGTAVPQWGLPDLALTGPALVERLSELLVPTLEEAAHPGGREATP
ncbi:arsenic transporter [Corallococcus praedator]|uniref:arsenite-transporting ATPase n=1 Tax=Corallococcus praedator TaxID=2316724 RepID=A0ABX9QAS0_9BACT|nr:arsenic transporter [Corallococcus sp. CA047B]RKH22216.1 arsenic transporter [Corallococcus sp. CA031C]RKH95146.1 arsenic transporter [Corallococcus praedator]